MDRLRRAREHTIWAPGAIPVAERKYRNLKRIFLPLYDLIFVWAGFNAVFRGIPALDTLLPDLWADALGYLLVVVALTCLVGVAFPALWAVEFAAKSVLVGILFTYFLGLRMLITEQSDTRSFLSAVVLGSIVLAYWRTTVLAEEAKERRAAALVEHEGDDDV